MKTRVIQNAPEDPRSARSSSATPEEPHSTDQAGRMGRWSPRQRTIAICAELTAPVGEKHQYSTINYSVLGLIVQTVAGRSYESYVQTQIFDPLQMRDSFTSEAAAEQAGLATGHNYWFGRPRAADLPYNRR